MCQNMMIPAAPNQGDKISCWYAGFTLQTFLLSLLRLLRDSHFKCSRMPAIHYQFHNCSSLSQIAIIADMCIPSRIICDSDPKILDTFDVFQDRFLQSIWGMDLLSPFPSYLHHIAFGRLKSHHHFLYQHSNWSISFWNFSVSSVSLISWWQTQSAAKRLSSESMSVEISFVYKENNKVPRTVPRGTPEKTGAPIRFCSVYNSPLLSVAQKRIYPFQRWEVIRLKFSCTERLSGYPLKCFQCKCTFPHRFIIRPKTIPCFR